MVRRSALLLCSLLFLCCDEAVALSSQQPSPALPTTSSRSFSFRGFDCYAEVTTAPDDGDVRMKNTKNLPAVLLIHGFGCSTVYWRETIRRFAGEGYTVHAVDLLGQGKSPKPGRGDGVEYSINLWAEMVDCYAEQFLEDGGNRGVVLVGNSFGSLVALALATGDYLSGDSTGENSTAQSSYLGSGGKVKGIGMYNCAGGLSFRNIAKETQWNPLQRSLLKATFRLLDALVFGNVPLLGYALQNVVTKDLLRETLVGLYPSAPDAVERIDDELVDSFFYPARQEGSAEVLSQIYTNDAGKTPMELHQEHESYLRDLPIHLVWGTTDLVTPLDGGVGQFYSGLAYDPCNKVSLSAVDGGHICFDENPDSNTKMVDWVVRLCEDGDVNQQAWASSFTRL